MRASALMRRSAASSTRAVRPSLRATTRSPSMMPSVPSKLANTMRPSGRAVRSWIESVAAMKLRVSPAGHAMRLIGNSPSFEYPVPPA